MGAAHATVVTWPDPGQVAATIVVCSHLDTCAEEVIQIDQLGPDLVDANVLMADDVLMLDLGDQEGGVDLGQRFADEVQRARTEVEAGRWSLARGALSEAERALVKWRGTPRTQDLFDLHFLRGAERRLRGPDHGHIAAFERAAAACWNQSVTLPVAEEDAVVGDYYAALARVMQQPPGTLELGPASPETAYWLDGTALGPGPLRLTVLAGLHRVNAIDQATGLGWRADVVVPPGDARSLTARYDRADDDAYVLTALAQALDTATTPLAVTEMLSDWGLRHGLRRVRVAMATPDPERPGHFGYRQIFFDPHARRWLRQAPEVFGP